MSRTVLYCLYLLSKVLFTFGQDITQNVCRRDHSLDMDLSFKLRKIENEYLKNQRKMTISYLEMKEELNEIHDKYKMLEEDVMDVKRTLSVKERESNATDGKSNRANYFINVTIQYKKTLLLKLIHHLKIGLN